MASIIEDIKLKFRKGNMVIKLIYVNVGVFVVLLILGLIGGLFMPMQGHPGLEASMGEWSQWLHLYSNLSKLIFRPWTLITHMFTHVDAFHVLFNMLMLYFSGQLFIQFFGEKKLLPMYLLGGLSGAVVLILASTFLPYFAHTDGTALGASAAVMAIFIAVCVYAPTMKANLFGVFPIELRYLGLIVFAIDLLTFFTGNTGGHIAHIVGAGFGYYMARQYLQGNDITKGFSRFIDKFFSMFKRSNSDLYVSHSKVRKMKDEDYNFTKKRIQERVDEILDKIGRSGYESLTDEEKDFLNKSSRQ
ncbi:MAG: rhomboid family intramembrane serine protease [Bacteroidetes bacterium]|nr:rhomboid family intramembrane serine protease [Bacteroidota bacterium]